MRSWPHYATQKPAARGTLQTFETIIPYTIEEAHEVAEAIGRRGMVDLAEELGDLLLQVVFHARMAEAGSFDFGSVVEAITKKMIRRHPHVFGDAEARSAGMAKGMWNRIKSEEKAERLEKRKAAGVHSRDVVRYLDAVPSALPGHSVGEAAGAGSTSGL